MSAAIWIVPFDWISVGALTSEIIGGFDVIFGSFDRIDIHGISGLKLKDQWKKELSTFLGLQINNFPNFLTELNIHKFAPKITKEICVGKNASKNIGHFTFIIICSSNLDVRSAGIPRKVA